MFRFAILSVLLAIATAKPGFIHGRAPLGLTITRPTFAAPPTFAAGHAFAAAAPIAAPAFAHVAAPTVTHVTTPGGYSHTYRTDVFHKPAFVAASPAIAVAPPPVVAVAPPPAIAAPIVHATPVGFAHTSFGAPATFGHNVFAGPTLGHGYSAELSYARGFGTPFARYGF